MCQMFFVTVLVLLGAGLAANSEIHSLTCIYTALSKPDGTPGIHKFTAMGLLDGRRIEYYDSERERKVPKQEWMRECLSAEYWGKGTEEQWLESLMNQMRQNDSVVHVLQGMRGCEGKMQPDGTLKFHRAMYMYAYDGHGLLSLDSKTKSWIQEAQLTMREWDSDQATKERIKGYLENVCIKWLKMFLVRGEKQLEEAPPPVVYVFAKKARVESNLILTCLATGFYTKDIIVRIKRNGSVLTKEDGLMSSGGLPNGDDTFQRRDHVEILKSDLSTFICNVTHEATNISVKKLWDRSQLSDTVRSRALSLPVTALLVAAILAVSAVLLLLFYKYVIPGCIRVASFIQGRRRGANDNQGSSEADTPLLTAQVQGYAQNSKDGEKILLTCIARGQGSIDVQIKRNGETVTEEKGLMRSETEEKGLMRSGTETNKDGPSEIRAHVEISKDDKSKYSYEVIYKNQNIKHDFDCALPWRGPSEVQRRWTEIHNLEDYTTDPDYTDT